MGERLPRNLLSFVECFRSWLCQTKLEPNMVDEHVCHAQRFLEYLFLHADNVEVALRSENQKQWLHTYTRYRQGRTALSELAVSSCLSSLKRLYEFSKDATQRTFRLEETSHSARDEMVGQNGGASELLEEFRKFLMEIEAIIDDAKSRVLEKLNADAFEETIELISTINAWAKMRGEARELFAEVSRLETAALIVNSEAARENSLVTTGSLVHSEVSVVNGRQEIKSRRRAKRSMESTGCYYVSNLDFVNLPGVMLTHYLQQLFVNTTNSYKYFFFFAMHEIVLERSDSGDELVITADELLARWLSIANRFVELNPGISFGDKDKTASVLEECGLLRDGSVSRRRSSKKSLADLQDAKTALFRYVPFRLLYPFFKSQFPEGLSDDKIHGLIARLSVNETQIARNHPIYSIEIGSMNLKVNPRWITYLRTNQLCVQTWVRIQLVHYLRRYDPRLTKCAFPVHVYRKTIRKKQQRV